ncbi:MAG: anti-sigma factor family protein [Acidimicrobiia bacterium]
MSAIYPGHLGELVSAYLDGELSVRERSQAEAHLAGCDFCRDELNDMMVVRARLRALPMHEAPAELTGRVPTADPLYRRPRFLVGAAAAAVALFLALASATAGREVVVTLSGDEFFTSFRARASLDPNFTSRLIPPEFVIATDAGPNG